MALETIATAVLAFLLGAGMAHAASRRAARREAPHAWPAREHDRLLAEAREAQLRAEEQAMELELQAAELEAQAAEQEETNQELAAAVCEAERALEALALAEAEQRALVEAIREVILILDREGRYVKIPPTADDLLHRPSADLIGMRMHDVMPAAQADAFLSTVTEALDTGATQTVEYSLPIGGEEIWFQAVVSPMTADRVVWVSRDITPRRRMEESLRASEHRYRLLFDSNPMPMWVYDRDTLRFMAVNTAAERQYGYTRDEFLALRLTDLRPPEDEAALRAAVENAPRDLHHTAGWRHRRKDGSNVDVEVVAHPIALDGHDAELVLALDVTERLHAEHALRESADMLRAVVDDSPVAIIVLGPDDRVRRWNPAAERLFGWSSAEMVGASYLKLVPAHLRAEMGDLRERIAWRAVSLETQRLRRDGTLVDVEISKAALRDAVGAVRGRVVIAADVSGRRQLEAQVLQSQKMEAVGKLAGGIAHDFNNLLTVITSYTALMLEDLPPGSEMHGEVTEIRGAAERAAALTRQLLAFSRQQMLRPQVLALNLVVGGLEKMLRRLVREDVAIVTRLDPALGAVKADPGQIEQALVNLVVNARDAIQGAGTIVIETANVEARAGEGGLPAGRQVMISVSDDGSGIPPEVQARIFEPFFTTKEPGAGTGLGLATVYGIVRQSGGHITVRSEPGKGTSFRIYLPRVDAEVPAAGEAPAQPGHTGRAGGETVLVVEDDAALRSVACRSLRARGYQVLEASSAGEALEQCARAERVDVVVTDVVMPGMGGDALAARIAERCPDTRVLLMSGYARDAVLRDEIVRDGRAFLPKPFSPADLVRAVHALLAAPGPRGEAGPAARG